MLTVFTLGLGLIIGAVFLLLGLPLLTLVTGASLQGIAFLIIGASSCLGIGLCVAVVLMSELARKFKHTFGAHGEPGNQAREKEVSPFVGVLSIRPGKLPVGDGGGWPSRDQ